jgi:hypothetical protein
VDVANDQAVEQMLAEFRKTARKFKERGISEDAFLRDIQAIIDNSGHAGCSARCQNLISDLFALAYKQVMKESEIKALATAKGAA